MTEDPRIPVNVIRDTKAKFPVAGIAIAAVLFALTLRVLPWSQQTNSDGGVQIVDYWESIIHFAYGDEPNSRRETYPDGTVLHGPLKKLKRHGVWTEDKNDETSFRSYRFGRQL